ncbi:hypothetical protein AJ87_37275 [Rhizobium yanglingense]|nr:hypothetical protein AJ87_37275 [Rhizobium yanglingense]
MTIHEDPSAVIGVDAWAIATPRSKADKIDTTVLAHLLRAGLVPEAWAPSEGPRASRRAP